MPPPGQSERRRSGGDAAALFAWLSGGERPDAPSWYGTASGGLRAAGVKVATECEGAVAPNVPGSAAVPGNVEREGDRARLREALERAARLAAEAEVLMQRCYALMASRGMRPKAHDRAQRERHRLRALRALRARFRGDAP